MRQPTTAAVKHWFEYLPSTGQLVWRVEPPRSTVKKGDVAGCADNNGYCVIGWQRQRFYAHRLIWLWHGNKLDPTLCIDHINRDKTDNRIENLRQVSPAKNDCNREPRLEGERPLPNYVYRNKGSKRRPYKVVMRNRHMGSFGSIEEAKAAVDCFISNNEKPDVRQPS